jgi:hypothetical protein
MSRAPAALLASLERELHEPSVQVGRASQLLADEFVEIGCSGRVYGKQ